MSKGAADSPIYHSRFKFYLRSVEERHREQDKLMIFCEEMRALRRDFSLRPSEQTLLFILAYLEVRAPGEWSMKTGRVAEPTGLSLPLREVARGPFAFLQRYSSRTLMDVTREYRPRHLPAAIFEILWMWYQDQADLLVVSHVPSPLEMLAAQCLGRRFVTLDEAAAGTGALVDGQRDAFEFVLHDLAHAHQFFKDPQEFCKQTEFFKQVSQFLQATGVLHLGDEPLREALDYLISDMNSHSQHLYSYLRAQLIQWRLRLENKSGEQEMSATSRDWVGRQLEAYFSAPEPQSVTAQA